MSRFDYVKYDETANYAQSCFKDTVSGLEKMIEKIPSTDSKTARAKALALTSLEETYMWIGKAIRDDQLNRDAIYELNEERG